MGRVWLGIDVGSDIALANAVGREIIHQDLQNREFIDEATEGFDNYAAGVEEYTLERAEEITGVPAEAVERLAHEYAKAETAQLCWTLGITPEPYRPTWPVSRARLIRARTLSVAL